MRLSPARYPRHVRLLLLTQAVEPSVEVLPALSLLPHAVRILPAPSSSTGWRGGFVGRRGSAQRKLGTINR